jgi:hypothetical protein
MIGPQQPKQPIGSICRTNRMPNAKFMTKNKFLGNAGRVDVWMYGVPDDSRFVGVIIGDTSEGLPPDERKLFDWSRFSIDENGNIALEDDDVAPNMPEMVEIYNLVANHHQLHAEQVA